MRVIFFFDCPTGFFFGMYHGIQKFESGDLLVVELIRFWRQLNVTVTRNLRSSGGKKRLTRNELCCSSQSNGGRMALTDNAE